MRLNILAALFVLACDDTDPDTGAPTPPDFCGTLVDYVDEDATDFVDVYCQSSATCDDAEIVTTTQGAIDEALYHCTDPEESNIAEQVEDCCDQGDGTALDAVRCWVLD